MKLNLSINNTNVGVFEIEHVDIYMGVFMGKLAPNQAYDEFREEIQKVCEDKGAVGNDDFVLQLFTLQGALTNPVGGIGIFHLAEFDDEIFIDSAGNERELVDLVGSKSSN